MSWRLARSLVILRDEINALALNRDKSYDGTIGDESHQSRVSDHNPNEMGVVCAFDATHDPEHGADMGVISVAVAKSGHPSLKYVIHHRRIWTPEHGWHDYTGDNPHLTHMHVSVTDDYDDDRGWGLVHPPSPVATAYKLATPYMRGEMVRKIQVALQSRGYYLIRADGLFGPLTETSVRKFQRDRGLVVDGVVGPQTMKALGV